MNSNFENKIVQVADGTKYYIVKELIFNEKVYLIANVLVNDTTLGEDVYVLRVENAEEVKIVIEDDLNILEKVLEKAAELI